MLFPSDVSVLQRKHVKANNNPECKKSLMSLLEDIRQVCDRSTAGSSLLWLLLLLLLLLSLKHWRLAGDRDVLFNSKITCER
jgi:hypothetical protein